MGLFRLYGKNSMGYETYSMEASDIADRWNLTGSFVKGYVRKVGCAVLLQGAKSAIPQDTQKRQIKDIRAGIVADSYILLDHKDKWVPAFGNNWAQDINYGLPLETRNLYHEYQDREEPVLITLPAKPVLGRLPPEVLLDLSKFKDVDYIAAVRASCKGVR